VEGLLVMLVGLPAVAVPPADSAEVAQCVGFTGGAGRGVDGHGFGIATTDLEVAEQGGARPGGVPGPVPAAVWAQTAVKVTRSASTHPAGGRSGHRRDGCGQWPDAGLAMLLGRMQGAIAAPTVAR